MGDLKENIKRDFEILTHRGNIAFYNSAEITNIFLSQKSGNPINIFSLVVFEEKECSNNEERNDITERLIPIGNRSLGISQKRIPLEDAEIIFSNLMKETDIWDLTDGQLQIDRFKILSKQFIPAYDEVSGEIPVNSILKNNENNGSYIIEFFSENKSLIESPIEKLSENHYKKICQKIMDYLPIDLLFLKDRMCNIIFQFPVCLLSVKTIALDDFNGARLDIGWNPLLSDLPDVDLSTYNILDKNIFAEKTFQELNGALETDSIRGRNIGIIKHKRNDLILWYSNTFYNRRIEVDGGIISSEPRIIEINGKKEIIHLHSHERVKIGNFNQDFETWINNRSYKESTKKLIENKEFLQYAVGGINEREKAISDLRHIIKENCKNGVYIWDPYANSMDILNTAYFCEYSNKKIKVINSCTNDIIKKSYYSKGHFSNQKSIFMKLKDIPHYLWDLLSHTENNKKKIFHTWKTEQFDTLKSYSNNRGINLEIRCQRSVHGWKFHDRFIIFPLEKPRVWSLGTSINSIGKVHSILMSVNNPQNILDAFNELWNDLEDSILFKYPEES